MENSMGPYPAAAVANRFLALASERGVPLTHMEIQKLVYFAHGWHLALEGKPLCGEKPTAFQWGPVFPNLYRAAKEWEASPIKRPIMIDMPIEKNGEYVMDMIAPSVPDTSEQDGRARNVIDQVWQIYGDKSAAELSRISHDREGPWYSAWQKEKGNRGAEMSNDEIAEYFTMKGKSDAGSR